MSKIEEMAEQKSKVEFKKWLEYLQQESWQLELIISSILLFVLASADESVYDLFNKSAVHAQRGGTVFFQMIPIVLMSAITIAKTNLIIHIFLRGFWIGCIGLRYVSNEINIDSLGYADVFSNFLKSRNLDFDKYLEKLEKVCSIIFSFTFLIIFEVFSIFIFVSFIALFKIISSYIDISFVDIIRRIFVYILLFSAALHFLDFISLGYFKKNKFISKIYYPFYRLYNFFSFASVYRPLYYNFIDNPFGRRYIKNIIPYIILLILFGSGVGLGNYPFLPDKSDKSNWVMAGFYDDSRTLDESENVLLEATIPSMKIKDNFLPVFLRYVDTDNINNTLKALCPDFEIYERNSIRIEAVEGFIAGAKGHRQINLTEIDPKSDSALVCLSSLYELKIDSIDYENQQFYFFKHPQLKAFGLLTYINIDSLPKGDHVLIVDKKSNFRDEKFETKTIQIPFVKYN